MDAFIKEFRTTNGLLLKERNNSLCEFKFDVYGLSRVIDEAQLVGCEAKGVTTRGRKTTIEPIGDNTNTDKHPLPYHDKLTTPDEASTKTKPKNNYELINELKQSSIPFPHRLRKEKDEAQQRKFQENLKQLHINIPFTKALAQMPKYTKFLKGLLSNKVRLEEACTVTMNERCFAVYLNKHPSKEKDLGSFTIPCDIGHLHIDNALEDLGVSISLMPYTMYEKLCLGEPKPTRMSLELAERSIQENFTSQVLEKRKGAIAWNMANIKGISPSFFTHKILMEESFKPVIQPQRRLNLKVQDVVKDEIIRLFGNEYYCLLDGFSGFFQIPTTLEDQEKTTFTCPYGTFAYRRMLFGLCNAPTTFQRCMMAIFHDMVEDFMEVLMDNFSVFGFNIEIHDKKGAENLAADHLLKLENLNIGELAEEEIEDKFRDEHLMILKTNLNEKEPWYTDYVNYIVRKVVPLE
uniref:Reverse transcriptase domain-containing protein n=1 Tax=Tanacetum cinerariifolium TaxID=118510 RepID=A0A6L2K3Q0_TANCI|nr:hypothetical protein [Tanacetum cinerariifolium]